MAQTKRDKKYRKNWELIKEFMNRYRGLSSVKRYYTHEFSDRLGLSSHAPTLTIKWAIENNLCVATSHLDDIKDCYWIFTEIK